MCAIPDWSTMSLTKSTSKTASSRWLRTGSSNFISFKAVVEALSTTDSSAARSVPIATTPAASQCVLRTTQGSSHGFANATPLTVAKQDCLQELDASERRFGQHGGLALHLTQQAGAQAKCHSWPRLASCVATVVVLSTLCFVLGQGGARHSK